jgi:hypothetical protein
MSNPYSYNLFYVENGAVRPVTKFHKTGLDIEIADFTANGRWAVVTTVEVPYYTGPCRVARPTNDTPPVVAVDIENNRTIELPVADLEKAL